MYNKSMNLYFCKCNNVLIIPAARDFACPYCKSLINLRYYLVAEKAGENLTSEVLPVGTFGRDRPTWYKFDDWLLQYKDMPLLQKIEEAGFFVEKSKTTPISHVVFRKDDMVIAYVFNHRSSKQHLIMLLPKEDPLFGLLKNTAATEKIKMKEAEELSKIQAKSRTMQDMFGNEVNVGDWASKNLEYGKVTSVDARMKAKVLNRQGITPPGKTSDQIMLMHPEQVTFVLLKFKSGRA